MSTPNPNTAPCTRTISMATAYGRVVASEEVPASEFGAALQRFHHRAIESANAVIVLDGVTQSRNSFLEFVRHFNETADRSARLQRA